MSSLVDYGSSDESENENASDEESKRVVESAPLVKTVGDSENDQSARQDEKDLNLGLFSSLPPPKETKPGFTLETDDERFTVNNFKHLQKKHPVKITIPSLSEVNGNMLLLKF
jgi:hypothetical protein